MAYGADLTFPFYPALDGSPLTGVAYFGVAGQNPVTNPITVYWDSAGTQPALQPVTIAQGRTVRSDGTPARIWVDADHSVLVSDSLGRQVVFEPNQPLTIAALTAIQQATSQAAAAQTSASASQASASAAAASVVSAQAARDAALIQAGVYVDEPTGRAAVADGVAFKVQGTGDIAAFEYRRVNAGSSTLIASYPAASAVTALQTRTADIDTLARPGYVAGFADSQGNAALAVHDDGTVEVPLMTVQSLAVPSGEALQAGKSPEFAVSFADAQGNVAFGVRLDASVYPDPSPLKTWQTLALGSDDSIVHIGDSYTAGHYVLKDKAFISQLAQLSPYRHQGYGVSGNDALDMQYRIVHGDTATGRDFSAMKARYAFIASLTNDAQFRSVDLTYYAENLRRLVETVRAAGTEPVMCTEFPATMEEHALLRRIADEYGCGFVDCTVLDAEMNGLDLGPFFQGHPGTRTGGVFWLPMLDFIDRMPKPERAIKIYRRRSTFAVAAIADLLYGDRIDRAKKWKELTVSHFAFTTPARFEELDQLGVQGVDFDYALQADEYQQLASGAAVAFTDYALLEITVPGTAMSLDEVELTLPTAAGTPTVYVRDFLDVTASMPGRVQGSTPTDPTYLSKWNKPRGAWRSLGVYAAPISIAGTALRNSMLGNTVVVMLTGAFSLTGLSVRYRGRPVRCDLRQTARLTPTGAELVAQPLVGTAPQLAAWTQTGAPTVIVPIDVSNAPRKPGTSTPVDGVCTISATDTIGQNVTLPAENGRPRRYMLTVWARYFPKAFLDPTKYPGIDASQVIDRIANPASAPITTDTCDLRTLKAEVWSGVAYPTAGGAEFFAFAGLQWRPVEFLIEAPPYRAGATTSFRLSCPDGSIQVAKASFKEVTP